MQRTSNLQTPADDARSGITMSGAAYAVFHGKLRAALTAHGITQHQFAVEVESQGWANRKSAARWIEDARYHPHKGDYGAAARAMLATLASLRPAEVDAWYALVDHCLSRREYRAALGLRSLDIAGPWYQPPVPGDFDVRGQADETLKRLLLGAVTPANPVGLIGVAAHSDQDITRRLSVLAELHEVIQAFGALIYQPVDVDEAQWHSFLEQGKGRAAAAIAATQRPALVVLANLTRATLPRAQAFIHQHFAGRSVSLVCADDYSLFDQLGVPADFRYSILPAQEPALEHNAPMAAEAQAAGTPPSQTVIEVPQPAPAPLYQLTKQDVRAVIQMVRSVPRGFTFSARAFGHVTQLDENAAAMLLNRLIGLGLVLARPTRHGMEEFDIPAQNRDEVDRLVAQDSALAAETPVDLAQLPPLLNTAGVLATLYHGSRADVSHIPVRRSTLLLPMLDDAYSAWRMLKLCRWRGVQEAMRARQAPILIDMAPTLRMLEARLRPWRLLLWISTGLMPLCFLLATWLALAHSAIMLALTILLVTSAAVIVGAIMTNRHMDAWKRVLFEMGLVPMD
jgi:hypothetical protein